MPHLLVERHLSQQILHAIIELLVDQLGIRYVADDGRLIAICPVVMVTIIGKSPQYSENDQREYKKPKKTRLQRRNPD